MKCPFCSFEGTRNATHGHLADEHGEAVRAWAEEESGRLYYAVKCPLCRVEIKRHLKPRWSDPAFITEFWPEIKLVAFDQLLHHYAWTHSTERGGKPPDEHA